MAIVLPFKGYRPKRELASSLASRPYDVLSSDEARIEVKDNPNSFLHIVKPEVDLPEDVDHYSEQVYNKGRENLQKWISQGILFQDSERYYYIYAQTMWGKTQYGLVGCASVQDYLNNVIKKHELTREVKEIDRKNHIRITNFNAEPVFFTYPDNTKINAIVSEVVQVTAEYDFTLDDGVRHQLWVIKDSKKNREIEKVFREEIPCTYVADGHHRTAAAAHVGEERKLANKNHSGKEEYNYFLAVHFPASQLTIIDYNRVIKDLNGLGKSKFIEKLLEKFDIEEKGKQEYKPSRAHEFSMYIDGNWYGLTAKENTYKDNDPIGCLDVTILSELVLAPILDITDLRKSERIDFVGGIRGLGELKRRVDSGEMAAAFALYPVSMDQLIKIADTGNIMPPKTTWFEPKLRSGIVIHSLE
ncbi:MAG: DUF1015 domain-containing protein [Bacteroidales bacterium]|nr:DUF1015 domain-containing protein [Bacteroidales bacterium]